MELNVPMRMVFSDEQLPAKVKFDPEHPMTDDEYFDFCMDNPDLNLERTAEGEIVIQPPAGAESAYRSGEAFGQLANWAHGNGRGRAFGSSAEYILPTRAALSPDASWVSNERISLLSREQKRKFPPVCPEFVIEVLSPNDRVQRVQQKMAEWMRAGVDLAWLIDGDARTIDIYRAGQQGAETRTGILSLAGEGPVAGFELDLTEIWEGL
jgi:Uma2 family endonuclease